MGWDDEEVARMLLDTTLSCQKPVAAWQGVMTMLNRGSNSSKNGGGFGGDDIIVRGMGSSGG